MEDTPCQSSASAPEYAKTASIMDAGHVAFLIRCFVGVWLFALLCCKAQISEASEFITILPTSLPSITVEATDSTASEITTDTGLFTITRTGETTAPLTVHFTVNGTATSGTDYTALATSVTIPIGATSATKTLKAVNDTIAELSETVILNIIANAAYEIGTASNATVTIADNETPLISLLATDANAAEQNMDRGVFTMTRKGNKSVALTVKFSALGTATAGSDYSTLGTSVVIPAGAESITLEASPIDDAVVEDDETVIMTLLSGTGYALSATKAATVIIAENELPVITLAATDVLAAEPGTNKGIFTITRKGRKAPAMVIHLATAGHATHGVDYTMPTSINLASGVLTATAIVTAKDDTELESDETVIASIAEGSGYAIGAPNTASMKIIENEKPLVSVVAMDAQASEEAGDTGLFTFTRVGSTHAALRVAYAMSGTAISTRDYASMGSSVVIPAGAISVTKTLTALDDTLTEHDEVAILSLAVNSAYSKGPQSSASVFISDNELPFISLSATDASAAEANAEYGVFTLTRIGNKNVVVNVNIAVTGTATSESDYTAIDTLVHIPAGESTAMVTITPVDDAAIEEDETVILTLASGTGYTASSTARTGTVSILENEWPIITVVASDADASEPGTDKGALTFTRIGRKTQSLTVYLDISGTATSDIDYIALPPSVTFPAGAQNTTLIISPLNNTVAELDESVIVNLLSGPDYTIGSSSTAIVTIADTIPANPFQLGVASGDPSADGMVLWTRLAPDPLALDGKGGMTDAPVEVIWQVASDAAMTQIVAQGSETATMEWAHSLHVEVSGLQSDSWYWYRFQAGAELSPVGRTRTLPAADASPSHLRFAVANCQNYESGHFTAYQHIQQEANLDLMVFIGDYIYESAPTPAGTATPTGRRHSGNSACNSLAQYRNRHAQYKTDSLLQSMHAHVPWFVIWDDHEVDNNYANDRSGTDTLVGQSFLEKRAAAYQSYYEHMPLRAHSRPQIGSMHNLPLYRGFSYGNLASFFILDTRQYRTNQPNGDGWKAPGAAVMNPDGTMLGTEQFNWLTNGLTQSNATWNILTQSSLFAPVDMQLGSGELKYMDTWSGYEYERRMLMRHLIDQGIANPIILSGDLHSGWANNINANFDEFVAKPVAAEFVATAMSGGIVQMALSPADLQRENPFVKLHNYRRGYLLCTVDSTTWRTEYRTLDYVNVPGSPITTTASFSVVNGIPGISP